MTRLRFVHAADLHLDSPFGGLRSLAPENAETLHQATFKAYDNIIDLCIQEKVNALLIAGDIFDGADRSLRAQLKFRDGLIRLEEANIRSFICHGNHDPLNGWEAQLTFPEGCHRFGSELEQVPVFADEPDRAVVYGISYPQRDVRDNLVPRFGTIDPKHFTIGLLHANVDSNPAHDSYAPCTLKDLEATGIDYWALGHVHTRQVLREANPTVVYPGNPQGRHPNESGIRGVYIVEVGDADQVRLDFRAVDVVGWATLEIDINALETDQSLFDEIVQTWISQIELNSLNMRPSGMERTIKLHTEPVNGHAIRSIPPLSWRNHLLTSLKVRNPRPLPKRLPRGGLFVLNDPITLSPIPSLPEWTILAPAEAG